MKDESPKQLEFSNAYANVYMSMQDFQKAMSLYGELLSKAIKIYGEESWEVGTYCNQIMVACMEMGRND